VGHAHPLRAGAERDQPEERALLLLQLRQFPRDPLRRQHVPAAADHRDGDDVLK
jgi:hypothetical protein